MSDNVVIRIVTNKPFTEEMRMAITEKFTELDFIAVSSMGVENE